VLQCVTRLNNAAAKRTWLRLHVANAAGTQNSIAEEKLTLELVLRSDEEKCILGLL